ncbi:MAG: gamma-glutamylcyclotransferase [Alphaproteobacteria bacterium]|nr:gamma-glutamylcyclotransferase [Alphaproteobacteria bacterium]
MSTLLFAYGTILRNDIQTQIAGHLSNTFLARLDGYRVCFGEWPYIVPDNMAFAPGRVLTDLSEEDILKYDEYEKLRPFSDLEEDRIFERRLTKIIGADGARMQSWVYFPVLERWRPEWLERRAND